MGVNSLPKTVTRQRRDCDSNPGPSAPESSTLTTRLPSRPRLDRVTTPRDLNVSRCEGLRRRGAAEDRRDRVQRRRRCLEHARPTSQGDDQLTYLTLAPLLTGFHTSHLRDLSQRRRLFFFLPTAKDELPPSPPHPHPLLSPSLLSHTLPLEVGPVSTARAYGGAL